MSEPYYVSPEWLVDGTGSAIKENVLIGIEHGKIISISDQAEPAKKKKIDFQPEIINLTGCTVLPGLIDSHVHLVMSGNTDTAIRENQLIAASYDKVEKRIQRHLKEHFQWGILAVRDGGDKNGYTLRYRDSVYDPFQSNVSVMFAGKAWHKKGRYGGLIGRSPDPNKTIAESLAAQGEEADVIKVVNSGLNSPSVFGKQTSHQFPLHELRNLVNVAARFGKKIMVHANGIEPVAMAVDAGCHSIEHGFFMGKENLKKIMEKGIAWVPTAVTMKAYSQLMKENRHVAEGAQKNLDHQLEQIHLARELGVKVVIGTDSGSPGVDHGKAVMQEMKLFMEAGYSTEEVVRCATSISAELLGLDRTGRITTGMRASFIVVQGPPSNLPDSLQTIKMIYRDGCPVYRKSGNVG